MKVKSEKIENENNEVKLEVHVEADKFQEAVKKSYFKNVKKFNVPGFRKGKAPMGIIKRYYGESVFYEDAINFCCDETYPEAVKEANINPVDYPKIDIVEIGEGKDFVYSAKVTVKPEVELGEYKGVEAKKPVYEIKDEDIENEVKAMQDKNARIETKDENGTVENGNIAIIDFKGFLDGKPFEGGESKNYSLEIGSHTFIDNFEEQLIGAKVNEEKKVNVKFPEDYGNENLNGKEATFEVKINEIKVKELPALDDEFAKDVSEFDTLSDLKKDIRNKMEEADKKRAEDEFKENVIEKVCDNSKVDIPKVMVDNEVNVMLKNFEMRLKYQGLDLKSYYKYTNSSEDKIKELMGENANKKVKADLVIEKIGDIEKIIASSDELNKKANELAEQYGTKDKEKTAKLILDAQKAYLEKDIVNEKVIELLVNNAKVIA